MIYLQPLLAFGLLLISVLVFIMIRQIGIISQRIPKATDPDASSPLPVGTVIPVKEFETYDRTSHIVLNSPMHAGGSVLMFVSFNCPLCSVLLKRLYQSPEDVQQRVVLFVMDTNIKGRFASQIKKYGLESFAIIEAYDFADQFRIRRAPFVYVVDEECKILHASAVSSANNLGPIVRKYLNKTKPSKEAENDNQGTAFASHR